MKYNQGKNPNSRNGFKKGHKYLGTGRTLFKKGDNVGEKSPTWKGGKPKCLECGKELSWYNAKRCINCIGKVRSGKNHFNWKGGISFEPYSIDWTKTLKRSIRERDNYICQLCNQYGNVVHHKDYDKKNCNPDNLITLCRSCNSKVNYNRNYWIIYFKK